MNLSSRELNLFTEAGAICQPGAEGACSICRDAALPGQVTQLLENSMALVEIEGRPQEVAIDLVDEVQPGDTLLVHLGVALVKLEPA